MDIIKKSVIPFLIGGLVASLVFTFQIKKIDPMENIHKVKFMVNGIEKEKSAAFIYNGDIYLSSKDIENKIGKNIEWDGKKGTIYVGKMLTGKYMSDIMEPYYIKDKYSIEQNSADMKLGGKEYNKGYRMSNNIITFNLDAKYNDIIGLIGLDDNDNSKDAIVEIYGDNKLIKKYNIATGSLPQKIDLNIKGVIKLDVKTIVDNDILEGSSVDLVDMVIK